MTRARDEERARAGQLDTRLTAQDIQMRNRWGIVVIKSLLNYPPLKSPKHFWIFNSFTSRCRITVLEAELNNEKSRGSVDMSAMDSRMKVIIIIITIIILS